MVEGMASAAYPLGIRLQLRIRQKAEGSACASGRRIKVIPAVSAKLYTSDFLRIFNALKIRHAGKKTFAMQSPLEQTVTHAVPSFAILRLRFAVCILTSMSFVGELAAQETFSCLGGIFNAVGAA